MVSWVNSARYFYSEPGQPPALERSFSDSWCAELDDVSGFDPGQSYADLLQADLQQAHRESLNEAPFEYFDNDDWMDDSLDDIPIIEFGGTSSSRGALNG